MHNRSCYLMLVLILVLGIVLAACDLSPQPAPTATSWEVIVTATPTPTVPPTVAPSSTPGPTQPPTPTFTPPPTPVPPTPTFTPLPPPTRMPPTPTHTPRPALPQVAIQTPPNGSHSVLPNLVRVVVAGSSGVGLDRLELWGYRQGQNPQLYNNWPAGGQKSFTNEVGWAPPAGAGTYILLAYAYDVLGQRGQSAQITVYIDQPVQPTATTAPAPSVVGRWGADAGDGTSFILMVTSQDGAKLHGTFTLLPDDESGSFHKSKIHGNSVTIHADILMPGGDPITYNFELTLSGDGQHMSGQWSRSDMGMLQPITFDRLLG